MNAYPFFCYWRSLILFGLIAPFALSGQNLVPNAGFENFSNCPTTSCEWFLAGSWENANGVIGCNNGNSGSPDYFHNCGGAFFNFPNTLNGEVTPYAGDAVMGLATWLGLVSDFREYLQVQLSSPLETGKTYTLSFAYTNGDFVPALNYGGYGTELGVHFSVGPLTQSGTSPLVLTPVYESPGPLFSTTWQTITYTFTATANSTHLLIGNFRADNASTIQQFATPGSGFAFAYYYLDDIIVEEQLPLPLELLQFSAIAREGGVQLDWVVPQASEEADYVVERSVEQGKYQQVGERQAALGERMLDWFDAGLMPGVYYYRIGKRGFDGEIQYSSQTVVRLTSSLPWRWYYDVEQRTLQLFPLSEGRGNAQVRLMNIEGKHIFSRSLPENTPLTLPLSLPSGLYLMEISQDGRVFWQKIRIQGQ